MKLAKRITGIVTAAITAISVCGGHMFSEVQPLIAEAEIKVWDTLYGDYLSYFTVDEDDDGIDDYIKISGCDESAIEVEIPSEIEGLPVKGIEKAFYNCENLISITLPNTIKYLYFPGFDSCSNLKNVYISDMAAWCSSISFGGFGGDNPLRYAENLYLNGELLTDLVIPNGITHISDDAFMGYKRLKSVTIPDCVTYIGAFNSCENLENVYISDLTAWCNISFGRYSTPFCNAENFYLNNELVTDLVIPNDITCISNYAFSNFKSLKSIRIPDSVTSIGANSFLNCEKLESITIENPDCEIDYEAHICNVWENGRPCFNGTIYGYKNSTAQEYAEYWGYKFVALDGEPDTTTPAVTTTVATTTTTTTITTIAPTETSPATETSILETTISTEETTVSTTVAITTTTITTEPTEELNGDANLDGKVNVRDCAFIAQALANGKGNELPVNADFNGDEKINVRDAAAIASYLAKGQ